MAENSQLRKEICPLVSKDEKLWYNPLFVSSVGKAVQYVSNDFSLNASAAATLSSLLGNFKKVHEVQIYLKKI